MGRKAEATEHDRLAEASEAAKERRVEPTWDDEGFYEVSFAVNRSRRYHAKMQSFYQWTHDISMAMNALLSTGAFMAMLGGKATLTAQVCTGIVAALSALATVFSWSRKAKLHADLCRRFTELASKIATAEPTEPNLKKIRSQRIEIEKDEPPVRRLIDLQAHNEECRSRGIPEQALIPLTRWQRRLGYIGDFGMARIERWRAESASQ